MLREWYGWTIWAQYTIEIVDLKYQLLQMNQPRTHNDERNQTKC